MSSLLNKLKKLSFFTHYPKNHETLTIDNVTEEYQSKEEKWDEWFSNYYVNGKWYLNAPVSILKFTGTNFTNDSTFHGDFSNSIVDWGDGTIESPSQLTHTYSENKEYTIKIINAPYLSNCFRNTLITDIFVPNNVTGFGFYCFQECNNLKNIFIPNTVTSLGIYCFTECTSLKSINLPSTIQTMNNYCFSGCSNLISVKLNWTTSSQIVTYNSKWITNANSNLKFIIPQGTTSLYEAKYYPSEKLQEGE